MSALDDEVEISEAEIMRRIRVDVVDKLLLGVFVIALVGAPISVSRALASGWIPLYTLHLALAVIGIACYLLRERLSYSLRLAWIIVLFTGVGVVGLLQLGLLGVGLWWLVITSLLISVLYSARLGMRVAVATFVIVLAVAWCFVNGILTVGVDANTYLTSWSAWLTLLIATSLMPLFVFPAIHSLHETTHELLEQVVMQRDEIRELATIDDLTGMLRPRAFKDRLNTLLSTHRRNHRALAIMYVDLDGFKQINDTQGHDGGDAVLQALATRYREMFRAEDAIGRMGGDEFAFAHGITGETDSIADVAEMARRLLAASLEPVDFRGQQVSVGASIGISIYPDHGDDAEKLITLADGAMYEVKNSGKSNFRFASPVDKPGKQINVNAMRLVR